MFGLQLVDIPVFYLKLVVSITHTLRLSNISQLSYLLVGRAFQCAAQQHFSRELPTNTTSILFEECQLSLLYKI